MSFAGSPFQIAKAARIVFEGGVIAYPTEGVWGLGCDPFNPLAVGRILAMKQRPEHKGLILLASDLDQLGSATRMLKKNELDQLLSNPGYPITWLIPDNGSVPTWITGGTATLAVRITRHPLVASLCNRLGSAIVSTSANPGGRPAARNSLRVRQYFRDSIDYLLPGPLEQGGGASEIRHLRSGKVIRLRGN